MSAARRPFTALVLVVISTLLAFKAADFVVGWLYQPNAGFQQSTRAVALRELKPGIDISTRPLSIAKNLPDRAYRIRTDGDGYIVGPEEPDKPVDILFLGGSTTESLFVDERYRWPYLTGRLLKTNGAATRTLNGGVSGSHSLHGLIAMLAKGLKYRPKVVVLMESGNDFFLLRKTGSYWAGPETRTLVITQGDGYASDSAVRSWARAVKNLLVPNLYAFATDRLQLKSRDEWEAYRAETKPITKALVGDFRASLVSFVQVARAWGAQPVLMTQFNRLVERDAEIRATYGTRNPDVPFEHFVRDYAAFNQALREVAHELQVPLVDLAKLVPAENRYMYDAMHVNDDGSQLVAKIVSSALAAAFPETFTVLANPR